MVAKFFIHLCVLFTIVNSQDFLSQDQNEELLMVFEITRHGARNGLHLDYFNTTWVEGELTGIGKRQHYLIGQQMRQKYINEMKFLNFSYSQRQIYVRSTDVNRTIESAISQLLGLYPPSSNYQELTENQNINAIPPFNISNDILIETQQKLGKSSLPQNILPIPVHVYDRKFDDFNPFGVCPLIETIRVERQASKDHEIYMNQKFNDTIYKIALALNQDPKYFSSIDVASYADSLWSRYFEQYDMGGIDKNLLDQVMLLEIEFYNWTLAMNETSRKAFITGMVGELVQQYQKIIDLDKSDLLKSDDRLKLYFYSDHDDSIITLCDGFGFGLPSYPPFASIAIFELWKKGSSYYVNLTINDQKVPLKGACDYNFQCEFDSFVELVKQISFYDNQEVFTTVCGSQQSIVLKDQRKEWKEQHIQMIQQGVKIDIYKVLYLYLFLVIVFTCSYVIYKRLNKKDPSYTEVE